MCATWLQLIGKAPERERCWADTGPGVIGVRRETMEEKKKKKKMRGRG